MGICDVLKKEHKNLQNVCPQTAILRVIVYRRGKFLLYMDFAESEAIATAILVFLGMNFRREDRTQG